MDVTVASFCPVGGRGRAPAAIPLESDREIVQVTDAVWGLTFLARTLGQLVRKPSIGVPLLCPPKVVVSLPVL